MDTSTIFSAASSLEPLVQPSLVKGVLGHGHQEDIFEDLDGRVGFIGCGTQRDVDPSAVSRRVRPRFDSDDFDREVEPLAKRQVTVYRAHGQIRVKQKAQEQLSTRLADLKKLVLEKMHSSAKSDVSFDNPEDFIIDLNIVSGAIKIIRESDQEEYHLDVVTMGISEDESIDQDIVFAAERIRKSMDIHRIHGTGRLEVAGRDFEDNDRYGDYLGIPKGEDAFALQRSKLSQEEQEALGQVEQDDQMYDLDLLCENEAEFDKANRLYYFYLSGIDGHIDEAQNRKDTFPVGESLEAFDRHLEEMDALKERLEKLKHSKELLLIATLRSMQDDIPEGVDKEEFLLAKAEAFFKTHKQFGNGDEDVARKYRHMAAVVTAAALYGYKVPDVMRYTRTLFTGREYHQGYKRQYRSFLDKHGIDPNTHLGLVGELIRDDHLTSRDALNEHYAERDERKAAQLKKIEDAAARPLGREVRADSSTSTFGLPETLSSTSALTRSEAATATGHVQVDPRWFNWFTVYDAPSEPFDSQQQANKAFMNWLMEFGGREAIKVYLSYPRLQATVGNGGKPFLTQEHIKLLKAKDNLSEEEAEAVRISEELRGRLETIFIKNIPRRMKEEVQRLKEKDTAASDREFLTNRLLEDGAYTGKYGKYNAYESNTVVDVDNVSVPTTTPNDDELTEAEYNRLLLSRDRTETMDSTTSFGLSDDEDDGMMEVVNTKPYVRGGHINFEEVMRDTLSFFEARGNA